MSSDSKKPGNRAGAAAGGGGGFGDRLNHYLYSGEKKHVAAGIAIIGVLFGIPWYLKNQGDSSSSGKVPRRNNEAEFKYTGVRKRKWGKYVSEIRLPNSRERIWLGSYDTAEKAARAFDAALFCLRGPNARFNFPDDPPNIPSGTSLSPAEILVVSQQYGNSSCLGLATGGDAEFDQAQVGADDQEMEGTSPSSNSEGDGSLNPIDWSFLDMLNENSGSGILGHLPDFELFHDPGDDVYFPPHIAAGNDDDNNVFEHDPYFLWNF